MYKDFSEPNLTNAIGLLRDKTHWPEGFEWDYSNSCKCAMGLFRDTWAQDQTPITTIVADLIGIEHKVAIEIFTNAARMGGVYTSMASITPEFIADKLEELV